MVEHATDTNKLKEFLGRKLNESQAKIKKLGRKRKITKSLNIITTVSSMVISSVSASISMLLDKIQSKLDYVISCNGNLSSGAYQEIISEFNT